MTAKTPTNYLYHKIKYHEKNHNYGICEACNLNNDPQWETENHIIYHCPQYQQQRKLFREKINKVDSIYKNDTIFHEICNLLFPWKNEHIKKNITLQIWHHLTNFLIKTNNHAFNPNKLELGKIHNPIIITDSIPPLIPLQDPKIHTPPIIQPPNDPDPDMNMDIEPIQNLPPDNG